MILSKKIFLRKLFVSIHWTENNYKNLCESCDRILSSRKLKQQEIQNPLLHVIRPHPTFLKKYELVLKKLPMTYSIGYVLNFAINILRALKSIKVKKNYTKRSSAKLTDVLIVSHLINTKEAGKEHDFYYGNLRQQLEDNGYSVSVALMNHTSKSSEILAQEWEEKSPIVVLKNALNLSKELIFLWEGLVEWYQLKKHSKIAKSNIEKNVAKLAAGYALSGGSIGTLRCADQIKSLINTLKPGVIILTYEGHSWERLAFKAAKSIDANILCIGYQHATVFYRQHGLTRLLGLGYDPDVILTSGQVARNYLQAQKELSDVSIDVLGSVRFRCINTSKSEIIDKGSCLVIPEGVDDEAYSLFHFSLECSKIMPDIQFIWRLHPHMNFEKFKEKYLLFKKLPPNIKISNRSLDVDIDQAKFALYRGSSAVIQAVVSGVYPIYLKTDNEITVDPLFMMHELRYTVTNPDDFKKISGNQEMDTEKFKLLQQHCMDLFSPLDVNVLEKIIEKHKNK